MKNRQFTARNSHSRSASIGRNLNKLNELANGSNTSITTTSQANSHTHTKPNLSRSKSTDGVPKRTKSLTKLSALHPLKRSSSQQQVPIFNLAPKVANSEDDILENDDSEGAAFGEHEVTEEVDNFSDEEEQLEAQPEQVLSYKTPSQFSHTLIKAGSSFSSESRTQSKQLEEYIKESPGEEDLNRRKSLIDPTKLEEVAKKLRLQQHPEQGNSIEEEEAPEVNEDNAQKEPTTKKALKPESKEDLKNGQYYSNMILSQSTGVVRAFGDQPFQNSLLNIQNKHQDSLQYIHSNDHISTSNFKSNSSSVNSLRQFTMNQQLIQNNAAHKLSTSHDSSTGLSFRVEPSGMQMSSLSKHRSRDSVPSAAGTPSNFNQFLRSNNSNIETRTQQKLWLQRENSLLDFTALNTPQQANPQVRREFEKVSREYLNLKRFNNPILDSVKRTSSVSASTKKNASSSASSSHQPNTTLTEEKLKILRNDSIQSKLAKLWIESESSSRQQQEYLNNHHPRQQHYQQYQQHQRPITTQSQSTTLNGFYNNTNSLRSPVAPSTRAVDRANHTPETKRIDLSAVRLQEAEQLQKLA